MELTMVWSHYIGNDLKGPSLHPPIHLSSLQQCARLVTKLANEKV
jgi:hypothetical protein